MYYAINFLDTNKNRCFSFEKVQILDIKTIFFDIQQNRLKATLSYYSPIKIATVARFFKYCYYTLKKIDWVRINLKNSLSHPGFL
jgi:hypothetical protein